MFHCATFPFIRNCSILVPICYKYVLNYYNVSEPIISSRNGFRSRFFCLGRNIFLLLLSAFGFWSWVCCLYGECVVLLCIIRARGSLFGVWQFVIITWEFLLFIVVLVLCRQHVIVMAEYSRYCCNTVL